jgi:cytoskeletal protein CcmA (bactofilin family)
MWKKEEGKPQGISEKPSTPMHLPAFSGGPANPPQAAPAPVPPRAAASLPVTQTPTRGSASIGQGIRIKGEVTGSEDLYVDGLIDGKLNLANGSLTIGPNGNVKADVNAREVIIGGRVEGKVTGRDKVQLLGTSQVTGEVQTDRLAIEEGALLRGKVEAGRVVAKAADARGSGAVGHEMPAASGSAAD